MSTVAPGYVLHDATARTDKGRNEQVVYLRTLRRTQTPTDLLGAIVVLSSDESNFITGQTIVVDAGEVFT